MTRAAVEDRTEGLGQALRSVMIGGEYSVASRERSREGTLILVSQVRGCAPRKIRFHFRVAGAGTQARS